MGRAGQRAQQASQAPGELAFFGVTLEQRELGLRRGACRASHHLLHHLADFCHPSGLHLKTTSSRQAALTSQTRWALPHRLHSPSLNLIALWILKISSSSIYNKFNISLPCWPGRSMSGGSTCVLSTVSPVPGARGHSAAVCWLLHCGAGAARTHPPFPVRTGS